MIPRSLNLETIGMGELWPAKVAFTMSTGLREEPIVADLEEKITLYLFIYFTILNSLKREDGYRLRKRVVKIKTISEFVLR